MAKSNSSQEITTADQRSLTTTVFSLLQARNMSGFGLFVNYCKSNNSTKSKKLTFYQIFNWTRQPRAEDISKAHTKTNLFKGELHIALPSTKPDITEEDVVQCDLFHHAGALLNDFDGVRSTSSATQLHFTLTCSTLVASTVAENSWYSNIICQTITWWGRAVITVAFITNWSYFCTKLLYCIMQQSIFDLQTYECEYSNVASRM